MHDYPSLGPSGPRVEGAHPLVRLRYAAAALAVLMVALTGTVLLVRGASPAEARDTRPAIVGAWYVDAIGAPFAPHVMAFTSDGVVLIANPDAAERTNSSSAGMGAWSVDRAGRIVGQFLEVNADKTTNGFTTNLIVRFTLTVRGDRLNGPAFATYYDPAGHPVDGLQDLPATLKGQRIGPDTAAPVVGG